MAQATASITFMRPNWLHLFDFSTLSPVQMLGVEQLSARNELCAVAFSEWRGGGCAAHVRPSPALIRIIPELAHFGVVEAAGDVAA